MMCIPDSCFFRVENGVNQAMRKKKMRLCASVEKTFEEGFQEYILDCKARNLRQATHFYHPKQHHHKKALPSKRRGALYFILYWNFRRK